jgi:uncharacterized membrane protein
MAEYIPGVCNIGPAEIVRRKSAGWVGVTMSAILVLLFLLFHIPSVYSLIIFLPAALAASGFLQAYLHFCAGFGFKGVYNLMKPAGQTETVEKAEFRQKDKEKAQKIMFFSLLIGLVVAGLLYFLPL